MKIRATIGALLGAVCWMSVHPNDCSAFNLGYHHDLTVDVLRHEGFSEEAIQIVLTGNFFNDILGTPESFMLVDDDIEDGAKALAGRLHFDQLPRPELIQKTFRLLVRNARQTLQNDHALASTDLLRSQEKALLALGISLHMLQDFYAHSNWAELHVPTFAGAPPDATYLDILGGNHPEILDSAIAQFVAQDLPRTQAGLFTHFSADRVRLTGAAAGETVPNPGMKHSDLCKDWASRAHFDDAYRAAYKASLQWVRFFEHIVADTVAPSLGDPMYWEGLAQFTQSSEEDMEEPREFTEAKGTAHFLALYGGSWKYPDRWADSEIALHDLPNVTGFGLLEQLGEPFFWDNWRESAEEIASGVFEADTFAEDVNDVLVTTIDAAHECSVAFTGSFGDLPSTANPQLATDIAWIARDSTSDYQPNWLKLASPLVRDNDDGDGIFNINDEDPGGPSDYYVRWRSGPGNGPHTDYFETPMRGRSQAYPNWQALLPLEATNPASVSVQLWDSDDVDLFDLFLNGITFNIFDFADDQVDVSPDGADALNLEFSREPLAVLSKPNGVTPQARPYGILLKTSGNDDDILGDNTASLTVQATTGTPTTKLRLTVLEVTGGPYFPQWGYYCPSGAQAPTQTHCGVTTSSGFPTSPFGCASGGLLCNGSRVACEGSALGCVTAASRSLSCGMVQLSLGADAVVPFWADGGLTAKARINNLDLNMPGATDGRASDTYAVIGNSQQTPLFGTGLSFQISPSWELTYEGYVDDDKIPLSFEINSTSYNHFRFPANGRTELEYHLTDGTITGHADGVQINGIDGEDIIVDASSNGVERSVRFRVTVDPGLYGALPPAEQVAEYFSADRQSPDDNHIRPRIRIRNKGNSAVPLSEFTARYWYTSEGLQPQAASLDFVAPAIGAANVTTKFSKLRPLTGADGYVELGFKPGAGNLAANSATGEIQLRFNKGDWSNYHEDGDYSYDPSKTTYTEWPKVTLYRNGVLLFGAEPTPLQQSQIVRQMSVFIRDEGFSEANVVKPRIYVVNMGNVTIPGFHLLYHFTVENQKTPVLERWYLPQVTATLQSLGNNEWVVDYHFEGMNFGPGVVLPDSSGFVSGIHYSDWSTFDKANDFSNPGSSTFVPTNKLEVVFD